jgi:glycosyltransferase involved in cell wall biosynthesis
MVNTVLIYRSELLPISETFIQAQAAALKSFCPHFLGFERSQKSLRISDTAVVASDYSRLPPAVRLKAHYILGDLPALFRRKFLSDLQALQPRLLHAHFATDGVAALPLALRLQIPMVVSLHGNDVTVEDAHYRSSLGGLSFLGRRQMLGRRASLFLCVSEFIRRKAIEAGYPEHKLRVHYTGIDTERFSSDMSVNREALVLFVGRLVEKKGCEYLIRAMAQVQQSVPLSRLVVVGDGPLRGALERQASETLRNCQFLGSQTPEQIRNWMNKAKVFCTPSVTAESGDAEGFGMVFVEAQAMGLPVASFSSGGIPEAVADGETGLLSPEKDWRFLAKNIVILLTEAARWIHLSQAGQGRVRRDFDLRKQCAQLEQIYTDVIVSCEHE